MTSSEEGACGATKSVAKEIVEGKAEIKFPNEATVFYNPVQEFNRDLSICILRQFINDREKKYEEFHNKNECGGNGTKPKRCRMSMPVAGDSLVCQYNVILDAANHVNLSQMVIRYFVQILHAKPGIRILEALGASGLRSIRYAKEVHGIGEILCNDFSSSAVECMRQNIASNNVADIVKPSQKDAVLVMHENKAMNKRFDIVDVDPYGSPAHFLDSAIQCVVDDGVLMVTCTDLALLCGNTPEACFTKYGSMSIKSKACHEIALRILLHSLESHANRYGRYVEPLVSIFIDFYIRVFVKVHSGPAVAKNSCCKTSMLYQCASCESFVLQPFARKSITDKGGVKYQNAFAEIKDRCEHCGSRCHVAGPIWSAPIHNLNFVTEMLDLVKTFDSMSDEKLSTRDRIVGILSVVSEELPGAPLFYNISRLANIVHCPVPPSTTIRSAILNAGFQVSLSHTCPDAMKTNAPNDVIWDIVRGWAKSLAIPPKVAENSVAQKLLDAPSKIIADFSINPAAESQARKEGIVRFQPKQRNWGPKSKARGSARSVNVAYYCDEQS